MSSSYQTTRYNAEKGYYDVLQAANTVNLDKETVDRLNEHLKNTQAQFAVGVVAKADVLRSQVELVNAQQTLTQAENSYEVAVSSLNNVIGLPTATRLNLSQGLEYKPNDYTLDNCVTYAMVNRPEIHQAEASVGMAQAAEKIANAGNLPQVSLGASNQWSNDSFPGQNKNNWALGVTLTQNIWDYGVTAAKVREAKANIVSMRKPKTTAVAGRRLQPSCTGWDQHRRDGCGPPPEQPIQAVTSHSPAGTWGVPGKTNKKNGKRGARKNHPQRLFISLASLAVG